MNFMQFQAECISMFGSQIKALKLKAATNSVSSSGALKEQKSCSQKKNSGKDKKIKGQMELVKNKVGDRKFKGHTSHRGKPTAVGNCNIAGYVMSICG